VARKVIWKSAGPVSAVCCRAGFSDFEVVTILGVTVTRIYFLILLVIGLAVTNLYVQSLEEKIDSAREPNAMEFPRVREQNDVDNILDDYQVYLNYVLEVGNQTNHKQAQRLNALYRELKRRDEGQAARFLRGLRFEMVQKLEMSGMSPERASTNHVGMRKWVKRFLPVWVREADEYLFRARTNAIARRQTKE